MPFVTTTVQLPSAHARSSAGVDGVIGFTAVGDGDEEGFVGVGEAGDGLAEREDAAGAGAPVSPPESEPQPVSAAARARTETVPAGPRAADSLVLRRWAGDSDGVMGPFYTRVPGRGPARPSRRRTRSSAKESSFEAGHRPQARARQIQASADARYSSAQPVPLRVTCPTPGESRWAPATKYPEMPPHRGGQALGERGERGEDVDGLMDVAAHGCQADAEPGGEPGAGVAAA
ncbi:hypothetical protein GCM10017744_013220 [Streptomyces antimycoticus]|uniref:Uncharacterized protein n=1 Tax=Streptomyces antimycoticus TaxID=68175 RepID=A0A4D4KFE7_9ACTN|nr:hypothetical protein SANT12839_087630 [Streptomyces antimycoticus]